MEISELKSTITKMKNSQIWIGRKKNQESWTQKNRYYAIRMEQRKDGDKEMSRVSEKYETSLSTKTYYNRGKMSRKNIQSNNGLKLPKLKKKTQ